MQVLYSAAAIAAHVDRIAHEISQGVVSPQPPLLVGLLKGSFIFLADLVRAMPCEVEIDFLKVSSYRGTRSSGELRIEQDLRLPVEGRRVILVEDIVDTGRTIVAVRSMLLARGAAAVEICTLLSKPSRREVEVQLDYMGIEIEDLFVVGYGMDHNERWRQLPYVGGLRALE